MGVTVPSWEWRNGVISMAGTIVFSRSTEWKTDLRANILPLLLLPLLRYLARSVQSVSALSLQDVRACIFLVRVFRWAMDGEKWSYISSSDGWKREIWMKRGTTRRSITPSILMAVIVNIDIILAVTIILSRNDSSSFSLS